MTPIQAGRPFPFPPFRGSFWLWEIINITVPVIGILFLDWNIFGVVYLFWWELICFGGIGVLKILSASGNGGLIMQIVNRAGGLLFFTILYGALLLLVISFSMVEISSETVIGGSNQGLGFSLIVITANYLIEYGRSELATGRWLFRKPMEVIFERFIYSLPLAGLVLFAVIPLSEKFSGSSAEKVIAIGLILAKFVMDLLVQLIPGLGNITFVEETGSNGPGQFNT